MAGQPQRRESGLLYGDDPDIPLAMVRLEECMDGTGRWLVLLNSPAAASTQRAKHPNERSARAELERVYADGREHGEWTITRVEPDQPEG